jgi:hypothetical protein
MNYSLLCSIALFLLLFIYVNREGYFSDANISATTISINQHITELNTLKTDLTKVTNIDLPLDAQARLNPIVNPKKSTDYTPMVMQQANIHSKRISEHQNNIKKLTEVLFTLKNTKVTLNDGTYGLSVAIDKLIEDAKSISTDLNQIPDS